MSDNDEVTRRSNDRRVLLLLPKTRDAESIPRILAKIGVATTKCSGIEDLCTEIGNGVGAVLMEEGAALHGHDCLRAHLKSQPVWSEVPIIVLLHRSSQAPIARGQLLLPADMILVERPVSVSTLVTLVRSALRGRLRQYLVRDQVQALEEARDAAQAAVRAKAEFMANMSHEIRTPMNGVLGITDLLLTDTGLSTIQRQYLEMVKSSGEALLNVVNDVLDFSKMEAGKVELDNVPFDLREMVDKVSEVLVVNAHAKGLELSVAVEPHLPDFFIGDPVRLRQVLMNIVGNAVKFTGQGEVVVRVEGRRVEKSERWRILFSVTDTGIGIPQDKLEMLFDSFTQVDTSIARSYGGTGLGLAISKSLVERMGGWIRVGSREGVGSTFSFEVELTRAEGVAEEPVRAGKRLWSQEPHEGPAERVPTAPIPFCTSVLVVEDNPVNLTVAEALLRKAGAKVTAATDGREALEALAVSKFDVVLMDVQMPEMDGFEATKRIRENDSDVPIIGLTAHALEGDRERCLAAGMDDYLPKPVTSELLIAKVSLWAKQRRRPAAEPGNLVEQFEGDHESYGRIVATFRENAPDQMEEIKAAAAAMDSPRLEKAAHRFKGALSIFKAETARCLAEELEKAGLEGDLSKVRLLVEQLEEEMARVMEKLQRG